MSFDILAFQYIFAVANSLQVGHRTVNRRLDSVYIVFGQRMHRAGRLDVLDRLPKFCGHSTDYHKRRR